MKKQIFRRRHYLISKRFQADFSIRFILLIAVESALALGLFFYMSRNTLTTGYLGQKLMVVRTHDFFLPSIIMANLVIVLLTAAAGLVFLILISHRIAGPLYRFKKVLDIIKNGDLSHRFTVRRKDQLSDLAGGINGFVEALDSRMAELKTVAKETSELAVCLRDKAASDGSKDRQLLLITDELIKKTKEMEDAAGYFKTSKGT